MKYNQFNKYIYFKIYAMKKLILSLLFTGIIVSSYSQEFEITRMLMTDNSYQEKFPYVKTKEVILRNVSTASGKMLRVSDNLFMFKDVKVDKD
jgi:hypothetical protein